MHHPRRTSRLTRIRAVGFRKRMRTKRGRRIMNRKRRAGRKV